MCVLDDDYVMVQKKFKMQDMAKKGERFYLFNQYQITMFPHDDGLLC